MLNKKALAGTAGAPKVYVEDVFSTYLYTGNGATGQTITNGIDLSGEGGLVWMKGRSGTSDEHVLVDTVRGDNKALSTINTTAEVTETGFGSFLSDGFSLSSGGSYYNLNISGRTFVSWTFRKAPKFFDVVTYTGNGSNRTISHNLGSVPGMIIVKSTSNANDWLVYHRSRGNTRGIELNNTGAEQTSIEYWNNTTPTSTEFTVGINDKVNQNGWTYVAYLFAHDAGGFGDAGTDNIISCGSYTGNGSATGPTITLGYEPQYVLIKRTNSTGNWSIYDAMRGLTVSGVDDAPFYANTSAAEGPFSQIQPLATGFQLTATAADVNASGSTYIYMAIRRPMKTPTSGTEVFSPNTQTGAGTTAGQIVTTGFPVDWTISKSRVSTVVTSSSTRLTGSQRYLVTGTTAAEGDHTDWTPLIGFDNNTGILDANYGYLTVSYVSWNFRRARGFFDVVCYTGTGSARTVTHNLGVAPELMIVKRRSATEDWAVYSAAIGNTNRLILNLTNASASAGVGTWNNTSPTATEFTVGTSVIANGSGSTYVAYLFASVNGVSKVGSYTGNGTNQTINCGFSAGARFVLIKRTDSTGDWCVFDTARGIVSGNDPFLQLNSTAAEVTNEDAVDPDNSGFIVNQTTENLNVNNATYIFLAVA